MTRPRHGREFLCASEVTRAEALFASHLQSSGRPHPDQVRQAVATTLRRLGIQGCAAQMASEFGDHPDIAVARMSWARATIQAVYPALPVTSAGDLRSLAIAR